MFTFSYCPNRTSRVLDIEIAVRETRPGVWDADCQVYETTDGGRKFRGAGSGIREVAAPTEDAFMDEVENRITADIEQGRGVVL